MRISLFGLRADDRPTEIEARQDLSDQLDGEVSASEAKEAGDAREACGLWCGLCTLGFDSDEEEAFRAHYKAPEHLENLREQRLQQALETEQQEDSGAVKPHHAQNPQKNLVWFKAPSQANHTATDHYEACYIYAEVLYFNLTRRQLKEADSKYLDANEQLSRLLGVLPQLKCCLLLLSGGDFFGGIFEGSQLIVKKGIHKYVTRRKQGTLQSVSDNKANRAAKSAGANLRRQGEKELKEGIQGLLAQDWRAHLSQCHVIYTAFPEGGKSFVFDSKVFVLYDYDSLFRDKNLAAVSIQGVALSQRDQRIRKVSFPISKPTATELMRVHDTLFSFGYLKIKRLKQQAAGLSI